MSRGSPTEDLTELARAKLVKVLGPEQGHRIFEQTLREMNLVEVANPDVLHGVSQHLLRHGGMIGAVGAMLGMMAVLRGAHGGESSRKP